MRANSYKRLSSKVNLSQKINIDCRLMLFRWTPVELTDFIEHLWITRTNGTVASFNPVAIWVFWVLSDLDFSCACNIFCPESLHQLVRSSMMISLFLTQSLQFRRINPKSLAIACSLVHSPFISWFRIPEFLVKVWFIMAHGPKFHDYPDSLAIAWSTVHSP